MLVGRWGYHCPRGGANDITSNAALQIVQHHDDTERKQIVVLAKHGQPDVDQKQFPIYS